MPGSAHQLLSISFSTLDSDCLLCVEWEFLLGTSPLKKNVIGQAGQKSIQCFLTSTVKCREGLVVFTRAIFRVLKCQQYDSDTEKHVGSIILWVWTWQFLCSQLALDEVVWLCRHAVLKSMQDQRLLASFSWEEDKRGPSCCSVSGSHGQWSAGHRLASHKRCVPELQYRRAWRDCWAGVAEQICNLY